MKPLLFIALVGLSGSAWGQGCPQGTPNTPNCIPPDHPASPYADRNGSTQPPMRRMIWADRWGAVAIDNTVKAGGIGTISDMPSKRKAQKAALAQCRATGGGKECHVYLTYHNGCGAVAWGNNAFTTYQAPTIEEASKLAVQDCKAKTTDCQIFTPSAAWLSGFNSFARTSSSP